MKFFDDRLKNIGFTFVAFLIVMLLVLWCSVSCARGSDDDDAAAALALAAARRSRQKVEPPPVVPQPAAPGVPATPAPPGYRWEQVPPGPWQLVKLPPAPQIYQGGQNYCPPGGT